MKIIQIRRVSSVAQTVAPGAASASRHRQRATEIAVKSAKNEVVSLVDKNQVGIQYLSKELKAQLFPKVKKEKPTSFDQEKIRLSQKYLKNFNLLNKKTNIAKPINFNVPRLQGKSLNEHFIRLAINDSHKYTQYAQLLAQISLPQKPEKWLFKSGWYRYSKGEEPKPVEYPLEDILVFDVESMYKISKYAVLATCASPTAWYAWVSPYLTGESKTNNHLIPMNTLNTEKLVVGHNVAYDRARIKDEYSLTKTQSFFLDTLSLHVAVTGICSRQRPLWAKINKYQKQEKELQKQVHHLLGDSNFADHLFSDKLSMINTDVFEKEDADECGEQEIKDDPWASITSTNSLDSVYELHCRATLDKSDRDFFKSLDKSEIVNNFQKLTTYCANDVVATHKVFAVIYPRFLSTCPHPVSFSALRHINSLVLPTTEQTWTNYIKNAEQLYQKNTRKVQESLQLIARELVEKFRKDPETILNDFWYKQLDWTVKPVRMTKKGVPYKNQKLPGYPEWYRSMVPNSKCSTPKITMRTRIVPILLQLRWENHPLVWTDTRGWCFKVKANDFMEIDRILKKNYKRIVDFSDDPNFEALLDNYEYVYFKVPHPNGAGNRVTSLTSKNFLKFHENGTLCSNYELAGEIMELNSSASYWISSRERIMNQFVVYKSENCGIVDENDRLGLIVPEILPMGTITRRAVERTWLTASNVKKNRIGSELKTKIQAPKGYSFIGADVDSEELWIASLLSDAVFKIHGGSSIGWMTLEGNKNDKTDLHSKTAEILGISRNEAKVFNYSRIYGAGLKHTSTLLKQFNPTLNDEQVATICNNLFDSTKGKIIRLSKKQREAFKAKGVNLAKIWYGGSESVMFNELENLAENSKPTTPVLKAGITEALKRGNLKSNSFLPSRVNWAIQSSGVDYLHLLITSMEYLIAKYSVDARLCITVHDEIRYLVKNEDKYKVAMLLQLSNLWTRAMFCEQVGINNIPQSCAFFSAVDIDTVLRKEVDTSVETLSNKNIYIPDGESLDIMQLIEKFEGNLDWLQRGKDFKLSKIGVDEILKQLDTQEKPKMSGYEQNTFLRLQIEKDTTTAKRLLRRVLS